MHFSFACSDIFSAVEHYPYCPRQFIYSQIFNMRTLFNTMHFILFSQVVKLLHIFYSSFLPLEHKIDIPCTIIHVISSLSKSIDLRLYLELIHVFHIVTHFCTFSYFACLHIFFKNFRYFHTLYTEFVKNARSVMSRLLIP